MGDNIQAFVLGALYIFSPSYCKMWELSCPDAAFSEAECPSVWVTLCSRHAEFSNIITQLPLLLTSSIPCIHIFGDCHCHTKVMWQEVILGSVHIYHFLLPETRSKRKHIWVCSGRKEILDNISMHETHQFISNPALFTHLSLEFIFSTAEKKRKVNPLCPTCALSSAEMQQWGLGLPCSLNSASRYLWPLLLLSLCAVLPPPFQLLSPYPKEL